MKNAYYFPHDYNARGDDKIVKLITKEGWEGYGLFWAIVEKLYENGGRISREYFVIAKELRTKETLVKRIIEDYGLFYGRGKYVYSQAVTRRRAQIQARTEAARKSAEYRWNKPKTNNANAMRTQCERNARNESKGKETEICVSDETRLMGSMFPHRKKQV